MAWPADQVHGKEKDRKMVDKEVWVRGPVDECGHRVWRFLCHILVPMIKHLPWKRHEQPNRQNDSVYKPDFVTVHPRASQRARGYPSHGGREGGCRWVQQRGILLTKAVLSAVNWLPILPAERLPSPRGTKSHTNLTGTLTQCVVIYKPDINHSLLIAVLTV